MNDMIAEAAEIPGRAASELSAGLGVWLPIETAPKDGTRVMLYYPKRNEHEHPKIVFGRWDINRYAKHPNPYWTNDQETLWGIRQLRAAPPTFWMPSPEAPNAGGNQPPRSGD